MSRIIRISKITIVSLILTLFVGAPVAMQSAAAAGTVTKTINVKDSTGAALPNALVAVGYEDANAPGGWVWTEPVTTNSSGQAVLTNLPQLTSEWTELYVEPPVSNTVDAFGFMSKDNGNFDLSSSSTVNIDLQAATVRVNLVKSGGGAAPVHSYLAWPKDSSRNVWNFPNILREGPFGIYVDSSLNCNTNSGNWNISFGYPDSSTGEASNSQYILNSSGCNPTRTISFKEPISDTTAQQVDGVWQLKSYKRNFFFNIVGPNSYATLQDTWLDVCKITNNNEQCFGANGNIGVPDGEYKLRANPGSTGFATSLFTANISNNGATVSLKVGYPASTTDVPLINGRYKFALGNPNLSGWITKPNGETITLTNNQGFDVALLKYDGQNYQWVTSTWSSGRYGFNIDSTGQYKVQVRPYGFTEYAAATSPVITVTNSNGIKLSWNGATAASAVSHDIALAVPNVVFNVINPINGQPLPNGWITLEKILGDNGQRQWEGNLDISDQNPGRAAGLVGDGSYLVTVNPPQGRESIAGLAQRQYFMVVNGSTVTVETGTAHTSNYVIADQAGIFNVSVDRANITGTYVDRNNQPVISNNTSNANVCIQKLRQNGLDWDYLNCTNTGSTGTFSISLHQEGTFRLLFEPMGRSDIASSYSETFVLNSSNVASYTHDYGSVQAAAPTLKLRVREDGSTSNVKYSGIEIRKGDQWIGWANTAQNGVVAVTLSSAGTYTLTVNPTDNTPNSSRKQYTVTATSDGSGNITATIAGVTADSSGISTLTLGTAQLKGHVYGPTGTTGLRDSWVVAIDTINGNQEMWQYGTNTRSDGSWSMSLPAGTYSLYARTPYGNTNYGDSAPMGVVTVDAQGVTMISGDAQTAGLTSSAFDLRLANPYWKGIVKDPSGTSGISNARVCLNVTIAGNQIWKCANTDGQGNWVMAKPAGFVSFGDNDQLQIAENQNAQYSMATYQGAEIEGTAFKAAGAANAVMLLAAPNFRIRVVYGQNLTPANNMWVNLNAIAGGWLGGSQTDANGYAKFRVDDLTQGVQVQIDPNNNADIAAVTTTTMKRYENADMASYVTGSGASLAFSDTITMSVPNFTAIVRDPGNNNSTVANSWVEVFNASTGEWRGGSNSNFTGNLSLNIPAAGTYNVKVNPAWNGTSTATSHTYSVVVDGGGVVTSVIDKAANNAAVTSVNGAYPLTLGTPSVTGVVKTPTGELVQNSWVVPLDGATNNQLWQLGSNSRANGSFSMAVPNGSYRIQANAPWNSSTYSASAGCSVVIENGVITTSSGGCVGDNHQLTLNLRLPNLTVHVTDKDGTALQNAHVGVGLGNWNVHAQTDKSGNAALFIDPIAIGTANNGKITGSQNLWMWIDPPYGNSNVVRTQCYSGQAGTPCANLAQVTPGSGDFVQAQINAPLPAPNTTIYVKRPDGTTSAGANAWVSIMSVLKNQQGQEIGRNWIAGGNTDSTGKATFNIVDTSVAFIVQVEAPWDQRGTYAGATYDTATGVFGLAWSSINNQNFSLSTPNLTIIGQKPGTTVGISSGWVGVEKADNSNNSIGWFAGYGLDQNGQVSMQLPASGRFKVTVNPGPGVPGASTTCIVSTDGSAVVSIISGQCANGSLNGTIVSLPLATGNVTGTVIGPDNKPVVGAIVSANTSVSPSEAKLQVTSTDELGNYSFQLDASVNWDITVTPVNLSTDVVKLASQTLTNQDVPNSGQLDADAQLAAVVG